MPLFLAVILAVLQRASTTPLPQDGIGVQITGVTVSQSLYQAAALGAVSIGTVAHRTLRNSGLVLSPTLSTDLWIQVCIHFVTAIWILLTGLSMTVADDKPCTISASACLDRFSHMPWVLIGYCFCFSATVVFGTVIWRYPDRPTYGSWKSGLSVFGRTFLYFPMLVGFGVGGYGNWKQPCRFELDSLSDDGSGSFRLESLLRLA